MRCECHGEVMQKVTRADSPKGYRWRCAVKKRERDLHHWHATGRSYSRMRRRLRLRIEEKKARLAELESEILK